MKISFLGDISLNDDYIKLYNMGENPFESIGSVLYLSDHVVGNLECMAKGDIGQNLLKKPRLTTTVDTLNFLKKINLSIACLAQNHVYDHLDDGFLKTKNFLNINKIQYLGAGNSIESAAKEIILRKNDLTVGILNYVTQDTNPNIPENSSVHLNLFDKSKVIHDIQRLKPIVNHLVIELHWGGRVEGGLYPDFYQNKLAKLLIDEGADLIIGHHSHTFQPYEKYKGKYIFYSLGNFCFSDYLFNDVKTPLPLRRKITAIVNVDFKRDAYHVDMSFYRNDITSFSPLVNYCQKVKIRNFIFKYLLRFKVIWNLYYLYKKYILQLLLFIQRSDICIVNKFKRLGKSLIKRLKSLFTSERQP